MTKQKKIPLKSLFLWNWMWKPKEDEKKIQENNPNNNPIYILNIHKLNTNCCELPFFLFMLNMNKIWNIHIKEIIILQKILLKKLIISSQYMKNNNKNKKSSIFFKEKLFKKWGECPLGWKWIRRRPSAASSWQMVTRMSSLEPSKDSPIWLDSVWREDRESRAAGSLGRMRVYPPGQESRRPRWRNRERVQCKLSFRF